MPETDLNSRLLSDSVRVDLAHGVLSAFLDFPDESALYSFLGAKSPDAAQPVLTAFATQLVYRYAPHRDVKGYTDFDPTKPIFLKKLVFLSTPNEHAQRGQALRFNVWFTQEIT